MAWVANIGRNVGKVAIRASQEATILIKVERGSDATESTSKAGSGGSGTGFTVRIAEKTQITGAILVLAIWTRGGTEVGSILQKVVTASIMSTVVAHLGRSSETG